MDLRALTILAIRLIAFGLVLLTLMKFMENSHLWFIDVNLYPDFNKMYLLFPFVVYMPIAIFLLWFSKNLTNMVIRVNEEEIPSLAAVDKLFNVGIRLICLYVTFRMFYLVSHDLIYHKLQFNPYQTIYTPQGKATLISGLLQIVLAIVVWFSSPRIICFTNRISGIDLPEKK